MKKLIIFIQLTCLCGIAFAGKDSDLVVNEMKSFFFETLKENYGDKPEDQLLLDFFTDYKDSNGEVVLLLDKKKLEKLNFFVLEESVYYRYFIKLFFAKSKEDFNRGLNDSTPKFIFEKPQSKEDYQISRFDVYVNHKYVINVNAGAENEAYNCIMDYRDATGIISYHVVADAFLKCSGCLLNEDMKEFLAVIFWKYLCDLSGFEFYKME